MTASIDGYAAENKTAFNCMYW